MAEEMAGTLSELSKKKFSGLAVIVTNDYATSDKYQTLLGTVKDGEQLRAAFERFNFFVYYRSNVNLESLQLILREVASLNFCLVKNYICIAFAFSGHGIAPDKLVLQDSDSVPISDITLSLLLGNSHTLATIPKVFLIDACRGNSGTRTVLVPRGGKEEIGMPPLMTERGGKVLPQVNVPAEGNFLLAHSTMPNHKAFETEGSGGRWCSIVAEHMQQLEEAKSLDDILTDVNESMMEMLQKDGGCLEHYQQPEKHSRLNKKVIFDPKCTAASTSRLAPTFNPNMTQQSTIESSQQQYPYRTLLGRMLIGSPFKAEYSINKIYDQHEMSGATCQYQGILTLQSLQQLPQQEYQQFSQQYMTPELYPSIDHALEAAAKMAYSSVYRSSQPSVYVQPNAMLTPSPFPCSGSDSTDTSPATTSCQYCPNPLVNSPVNVAAASPSQHEASKCKPPNARSEFHNYCQRENVKPRFEFTEEETERGWLFKCVVSVMLSGKTIRENSQGYYPRKDDAKEIACGNILRTIENHPVQSRGAVDGTVSWISKLKEHYDKKGEPNQPLDIQVKSVDGSSPHFVAYIYIKELNRYVDGPSAKSKKEAKQSAAKSALQLLGQYTL